MTHPRVCEQMIMKLASTAAPLGDCRFTMIVLVTTLGKVANADVLFGVTVQGALAEKNEGTNVIVIDPAAVRETDCIHEPDWYPIDAPPALSVM